MEKFKFGLTAVLKVRKSREEEALRNLSVSQKVYQGEIAKKQTLVQDLSQALLKRENLADAAMVVSGYTIANSFISGTKQRIMQADQAIMRAKKNVEKSLRGYLAIRKQTKAIEVLRDKSFAEFRLKKSRLDQKRLDDMILMRTHLPALMTEEEADDEDERQKR